VALALRRLLPMLVLMHVIACAALRSTRARPRATHRGLLAAASAEAAPYDPSVDISYEWRGEFDNDAVNRLHAEAFETEVFCEEEWNWRALTSAHSLGWVTARDGTALVGFVNVLWDGLVHAWIQDTMVAASARRRGLGTALVEQARRAAREAGCEWLQVDFDDHLRGFYLDSCGFRPTSAGLIELQQ
jgi:GNAT superfamily N-acetyltransferase